jgi:peptidoglycan/LPS O-acetylase OafA/YrhL
MAGTHALVGFLLIVVVLAVADRIPRLLLHNGLLDPLFAFVLFEFAHDSGNLARALSWRPLLVLGEASYGLYIIHVPLRDFMRALAARVDPSLGTFGASWFALYAVVAVIASLIMHTALEAPARDWLRQMRAASARLSGAA